MDLTLRCKTISVLGAACVVAATFSMGASTRQSSQPDINHGNERVDTTTDAYGRMISQGHLGAQMLALAQDEGRVSANASGPLDYQLRSSQATSVSFDPYVAFPTGGEAYAIAIGDMTGDGLNDVVAVSSSYDSVYVLAQHISGALQSYQSYASNIANNGWPSGSVDIADINNDGLMDVVVSNQFAVGILFQNTAGLLDPVVEFPSPNASFSNIFKLRSGDFNHDGLSDVVSIDWGTQSHIVEVYHQTLAGTLAPPDTYTVVHGGWDDLAVGDVNSDGRDDIIVMSGQFYAYDNVGIMIQNAERTFDDPVYYDLGSDINANGIAVGDVSGDGLDDVVLSYGGNRPRSHIAVFSQNEDGTLDPPVSVTSYDGPQSIEIADVNTDGRMDVVVVHGGWLAMGLYLQNPDGTLAPEELYNVPYQTHFIGMEWRSVTSMVITRPTSLLLTTTRSWSCTILTPLSGEDTRRSMSSRVSARIRSMSAGTGRDLTPCCRWRSSVSRNSMFP